MRRSISLHCRRRTSLPLHRCALRRHMSNSAAVDTDKVPMIGTHSGTFHCDEALAIAMLQTLNRFKAATVLRSRNAEDWARCDVLVDVGGVYDHETMKYDHHQRGFTETFDADHTVKLSSAGLVYKHWGLSVVRTLLNDGDVVIDDDDVNVVYQRVYDRFIMPIDAIDNGIQPYPNATEAPVYRVKTDLSSRVSYLNPTWLDGRLTTEQTDALFQRAVELTGTEFRHAVAQQGKVWLPARQIVREAWAKRTEVHASGAIIFLPRFCPWDDHLREVEEEESSANPVLYVLWSDDSSTRVRAVAKEPGSFTCRKPLPEAWCGLRDDALAAKSGIDGTIFVHANGFIGGCKTKEGGIQMAIASLEA